MYKKVKNACKRCGSYERYESNNHCVTCLKEKQKIDGNKYAKKYRESHKQELSDKDKSEYRKIGKRYIYHMWMRAKKRAEEKNIEFSLELCDIVIPNTCPVLHTTFSVGDGKGPGDYSPSIDRIDCRKGYNINNIEIISFKANRIKNDSTIDDMEKVLNYMRKHLL